MSSCLLTNWKRSLNGLEGRYKDGDLRTDLECFLQQHQRPHFHTPTQAAMKTKGNSVPGLIKGNRKLKTVLFPSFVATV